MTPFNENKSTPFATLLLAGFFCLTASPAFTQIDDSPAPQTAEPDTSAEEVKPAVQEPAVPAETVIDVDSKGHPASRS